MVIDLGDVSAAPETPRSSRVTGVRPVALATAVLAVLALGGSGAAAAGLREVLVTAESPAAFAISPSALFTSGYASSRQIVRRYSLSSRSVRWSTELPQSVGDVRFTGAARVLIVSSPEGAQASFLDSDTGAVLWRRTTGATSVLRPSADSVLMTSAFPSDEQVVLQRVGLRTGATLWSRTLDAAGYLDVGDPASGAPERIVTVDRRGRGAVLDVADGTVRSTADLGVVPDLGRYVGDGDTARFVAFGDRLYLTRRESGIGSLTAYRLSDLRRLWRRTATPFGWPTDCGAYLCLSTASGMTVVDADTGEARWSSTQWRLGIDSRALGIAGPPRMVVTDARNIPQRALLDPATGRVHSALGDSEHVSGLVLRADTEQSGRTWVQVIGARGDVRTLGALDGVSPERCAAAGSHLVCGREDQASVWRVPD